MKKFGGKFPLIVEPHPEDYKGYEFITLIKYNDETFLNIVDNVCNKQIITYVLDFCKPSNVPEELVIETARNWFYNNRSNYPISIEFSRVGIAKETSKILRSFAIDYVSRVIGPLPDYVMSGPAKVKKRKRKPIPKNMEYINKSSRRFYD
jgi:hypothetical protein